MDPIADVSPVAKVFPSEEALKKYLEDHPKADKSNHSVGPGGGEKKPKAKPASPHALRDRATEHEKAGRHDEAALDFMASAEMFRRMGAPEAAKSMDDAARESAKKHFKKKKEAGVDDLSLRVAMRSLARDFGSPAELKQYLKEHPNADKSKHHIVKEDGGRGSGAAHVKTKIDKDVADEIGKVWKGPSGNAVDAVRKMIEDDKDVPLNMLDKAVTVLHDQSNKPGLDKGKAKALRGLRDKLKSKAQGKEAALVQRVAARFAASLAWKAVGELAHKFHGTLDKAYKSKAPAAQDTKWDFSSDEHRQSFVAELQKHHMTFKADPKTNSVVVWF